MTPEDLAELISQALTDAQAHADTGRPLHAEQYARRVVAEFADRGLIVTTGKEVAEETIKAIRESRAKVTEEIAAEIERVVVSGDFPRPQEERGGFLNDARWAARIAREAGKRT